MALFNHRKLAAFLFSVTTCVGLVAMPPPAAADPGVVTGEVTAEATGQPVAGACVTLFDLELNEVAAACAGADGRYEIPAVAEDYYKARATAAGYPEMWAHSRGSAQAAHVVRLPGTLNFALRQGNGTLRGQVTVDGGPAGGAEVSIADVNQRWWSTVNTAADGTYAFTGLKPDSYVVRVVFGDRDQWVPQKSSFWEGTAHPVADGQVTVVDEIILPYKKLRVVVVDETTGAPVADACSVLRGLGPDGRRTCANSRGVMRYDDLPQLKYYSLNVWEPTHWNADISPVVLSSDEVTELRVSMRPAAAIVTTVRDARTKAPVANICVETHTVPVVGVSDRDFSAACSDSTGKLVIGPIEPGTYQLLVKSFDERYGMQWVGHTGGTGDLRKARAVTARLGSKVSIPPIRMDPAGTITGVVTDRATGAPVGGVCVYPFAVDPRLGFAFGENCSKAAGNYTIRGLGPYAWPVEFADSRGRYAWEWSGGAPDRFAATKVRVRPGAQTPVHATLTPAGFITGRTLNQQGTPAFGYIYTYNARTGDIIDWTTPQSSATGEYVINGLATQDVKIQYYVEDYCWHRDAPDFASATPVHVTAGQTVAGVDLGPCRL